MRCPRCSANIGPEQDWCLECGAPARTRLAPTPNWQLPTVAIGAIVAVAGAMLAFAFVKLTDDTGAAPATTVPATAAQPLVPATTVPPVATTTMPTATTTVPTATGAIPTQTTGPATTLPSQTATTTTVTTPTRTQATTTPTATTPTQTTRTTTTSTSPSRTTSTQP